ncbi:hypothetical protein M1L60_37385 [Actinoplanes sp. TRM 88003]|uniref:Uncharacterized protein n=1 Tax=Paractinoplanes aksuensis TaxID=2939490 RepID=A0ABT1E0A7_9ACTN|nr:hypothetical protein [Actinoplanes aksuensis]MCO8276268.1 hypothetical protein [Actinoplanes aksuensis]
MGGPDDRIRGARLWNVSARRRADEDFRLITIGQAVTRQRMSGRPVFG